MPRRNVSTTALQALNLLNGPFVLEQSELFAERLEREAATTRQRKFAAPSGWPSAAQPDAEELAAAEALVGPKG